MLKGRMIAMCGAVVALAVASAGVALAGDGGHARPAAGQTQPAALGDGATESRFVPISPCRIVDTRLKGGPIEPSKARSYQVRGTGTAFAAQGGDADGCGIPLAAVSIQTTITAVGATGAGFLKAYPGVTAPTATFLSYPKGASTSNGGAVGICGQLCFGDITLAVYGHPTQVVIDVQGYYIPPMWVGVGADGKLFAGSRAKLTQRVAVGQYKITFARGITSCGLSVVVMNGPAGMAQVTNFGFFATVSTLDATGTRKDSQFYLVITC